MSSLTPERLALFLKWAEWQPQVGIDAPELRALVAMAQERQGFREECGFLLEALTRERDQRVAALEGALEKYGWHIGDCPQRWNVPGDEVVAAVAYGPCECGFALLAGTGAGGGT